MAHHLYRIHSRLNLREMEAIGLLADGLTTNEIARLMGISHHTVRQYIARAVEKTGVADRFALIKWVREKRWAA